MDVYPGAEQSTRRRASVRSVAVAEAGVDMGNSLRADVLCCFSVVHDFRHLVTPGEKNTDAFVE